ncbi:MAG: hypothetical protein KGH58_01415 [Candidatus Micrarchaeota archaeon]|nr:hypothetical protein [Candidatus Micrarchaeota archaeon]
MRNKISLAVVVALSAALLAMLMSTGGLASAQTTPPVSTAGCGLLPSGISQQVSASAPWYCAINQQIYDQWSKYLPLAFAAVVLSFTIAGAIVMVGIAAKNDKIRNFGTGELYEAIATALIVAGFMYLSAVCFGLIPSLAVGSINPYATSFHLIGQTLTTSQQLYTQMYNTYFYYSYILSINFDFNYISPAQAQANAQARSQNPNAQLQSYSFEPTPLTQIIYKTPIIIFISDPARAIGAFLIDSMLVLYAEYYALMMFASAAIPAFLIPGIVLRSMFPTRALGGFMIALGISFFLIAPTLFALAFYFTSPTLQTGMQTSISQLSQFSTGPSSQPSAISASNPLVSALGQIPQNISAFWLLALFYPALIIAMVYAFVTQLSRFIGGASRTGSRLRAFI